MTMANEQGEQGNSAYLAAIARMQAKQESWARNARSRSADTSSNSESSRRNAEAGTSGTSEQPKKKEKRRKVAKACLTCQKSHLTCDEKRPCTRCVKKGIADQCVEGIRKKAKYLLDEEKNQQSQSHEAAPLPPAVTLAPQFDPSSIMEETWMPTTDLGYDAAFDMSKMWGIDNLQGTTASTEYQMLDAMLNSMSPIFPGLGGEVDYTSFPESSAAINLPMNQAYEMPQSVNLPLPYTAQAPDAQLITPPNFDTPTPDIDASTLSPWTTWTSAGMPISPHHSLKTPAEAYHAITKPYDYTEGYHYLMEYLTQNFDRHDNLKVVKSLATFRPSLIALQMPLSEEDEVFLERSFQRTLIELEKLISYSATPTAVWRRTGEIVYANPEFCNLVAKTGGDLLGKKTYIYLLFSKSSVISYWQNFSVHAFENTTQNFFQGTTLTVGDGEVACSCCFTIRRDVFDLPSVVIGQFLPVPDL